VHEPHRLVMEYDHPRIRWQAMLDYGLLSLIFVGLATFGAVLNPHYFPDKFRDLIIDFCFLSACIGIYLFLQYKSLKFKRVEIDVDHQVVIIATRSYKSSSVDGQKQYPYTAITHVVQYKNKRKKESGINIGFSTDTDEDGLFIEKEFCQALANNVHDTTTIWNGLFNDIPFRVEILGEKTTRKRLSDSANVVKTHT
jgi:hypothetical protein